MRVRTASIVAASFAALWLCTAPTIARAGTYVVHACRADGAPAPLDGWTAKNAGTVATGTAAPRPFDDCASGRGFGVDFTGTAGSEVSGSWVLAAPAGTTVDAISVNGLEFRTPSYLGPPPLVRTVNHVDDSIAEYPLDPPPGVLHDLDTPWVSLDFDCVCPLQDLTGLMRIAAVDVTLRDDAAPAIADTPSGTLLRPGPISRDADLAIPFTDSGSGVESVELIVDGVSYGSTRLGDAGCVPPFARIVPCPTHGAAAVHLDTTGLAAGPHRVSALLTDASGNATSVGPFAIVVDHPAVASGPVPPGLTPHVAAVVSGSLKAGFGRRLAKRVSVAYSKPPAIRGIVVGAGGKPLAGVPVHWSVRPAVPGASFAAGPPLTTDRQGRFSVRLPRGVSRTIQLVYGNSTAVIKLDVRAPVALTIDRHMTRNGRQIRFRGTVHGAEAARTYVDLQAWAGSWITFRTASLRAGRFHATYRFTRTFATTRYRFRAVVHADPTLPYASAASPVATVLVRP